MAKYKTAEWRSDMKTPKPEKMPRKYSENLDQEAYMKMPRKYEGEDTMLMPADKYGKAVDKVLGRSKGRMQGDYNEEPDTGMRKGGEVKKKPAGGSVTKTEAKKIAKTEVKRHEKTMHGMKNGGTVRGDGCAQRGKTKGRMV